MKIIDGVFHYINKNGEEQWLEIGEKMETNPEIYLRPKWHPQMAKITEFTKIDDNCVFLYTENGKYEYKDFLLGQSTITKLEER